VLKTWLSLNRISSAPISRKQKLSIKIGTLAIVYKIEEISNSKDNNKNIKIFYSLILVNSTVSSTLLL
jgi:hypothetical protein